MEKFKLIQTYPGSPAEETVVVPTEHDKDIFTDGGKFRIHRELLESYPDFWETREVILGGEFRLRTSKGTKILQAKSVEDIENGFILKFSGFEMAFQLSEGETEFNFCD